MSWIFLNTHCQEATRTDTKFGICDNEDGTKAYTSNVSPEEWIANVVNASSKSVTFIAVDKCILQDADEPRRGRCDGILLTEEQLYFVELKNQMRNWTTDAIQQLESTILFFKESHDINVFKHKKAFACNKKHKNFQEIDNETNLAFFRKHGIRLDIQAEIIVI
ncbi:hypothetical protein [Flavobacterium sp. HSC-61S13]|uniref:hypothetical protein n=1 Tax=Flavobacterium sp. HSC-61S13 TaxID=2910963 RepID=UPI00209D0375|nr:hypothetical protein [Flavobacterium sp. HSC-61S13]MCP1994379.1 hypothetical protein [Flavobacterium sp. HSC-61S13]